MPWLIGLAVLGVVGYFFSADVKKIASSLGQSLANSLNPAASGGAPSGIATVTIDSTTSPGSLGSIALSPGEALSINTYTPPAGYVWKFDGGGVMTPGGATATSMTFMPPATAPTAPFTVYANLVKAGATVSPTAIFSMTVTISS